MRVHITSDKQIPQNIDEIVWNKNPESRFQTKIGRVCYYCTRNYVLCKLCNTQQIITPSTQFGTRIQINDNGHYERRIVKGKDKCRLFHIHFLID